MTLISAVALILTKEKATILFINIISSIISSINQSRFYVTNSVTYFFVGHPLFSFVDVFIYINGYIQTILSW